MEVFTKSGGRLFRIALIFTIFCVAIVITQAMFIQVAMRHVHEIATMPVAEGQERPSVPAFYNTLIPFLSFSSVVTSLSTVLIAIAARYGGREIMQQYAASKQGTTDDKTGTQ